MFWLLMIICTPLFIINTASLFYRTLTTNYWFALALAFCFDYVSSNHDILTKYISIIWIISRDSVILCQNKTNSFIFNKITKLPLIFCNNEIMCTVLHVGPYWETSVITGLVMALYISQQVSNFWVFARNSAICTIPRL